MREKYIEERFPRYFVFGTHSDKRVDIATISDDTVATVSATHAEKLIRNRDTLLDQLISIALAFSAHAPQHFNDCWYTEQSESERAHPYNDNSQYNENNSCQQPT